ncbi:hypothetical protein [Sporosarcina newyorkensis]|uniref:hypothetical protein n=1 Tax=Sporosarcina newyorkensis TaxID=759851 RepID=UPI0015920A4F|nr:hypothetical protein [Sporosarcina newyorkensis]
MKKKYPPVWRTLKIHAIDRSKGISDVDPCEKAYGIPPDVMFEELTDYCWD